MKKLFTLITTLKMFVLLGVLGCVSTKALAQPAAGCQLTASSSNVPWNYISSNSYYYCPKDIQIGSVSPMYTFVAPSPSYTGNLDLTSSVSFAVTAGTSAPITADLYNYCFMAIYVDFNRTSSFTDNPLDFAANFAQPSYIGTSATPFTNSMTIPGNIPSGNYRCRIVFGYYSGTTFNGGIPPGAAGACANYNSPGALYNSTYSYVASVDVNLAVTNPASCWPPSIPTASSITSSSAVVNWNAPNNINNGYQWVVVPGGAPITTTPIVSGFVSGTSVTVGGLTPNTTYSVYVRSGCSATDSSSWAGPLNFTTLAPQCTTTPNTPSISTAPQSSGLCAGNSTTLTATNVNSAVSGVSYTWQQSTSGPTSGFGTGAATGTGATTLSFTTPAFPVNSPTIWYRLQATCVNGGTTYPAAPTPAYQVGIQSYSIPYYQDFSSTPTGGLPLCYEVNADGGVSPFQVIQGYTAADGTPSPSIVAQFPTSATTSRNNAEFTIPPLALVGGTAYTIQFNYSRSTISYPQRLQMYVNTSDPGTADLVGSPFVTGGTKIFDTLFSFNNIALAKFTYTPSTSGVYYFSWYDSSLEASAPALGTSTGIGNIAIYISSPCVQPTTQPTALNFTSNVSTITGTFTPASPVPNKYLVVRTLGTTPLSGFTPTNGAYYTLNQTVGNGTIVYNGKNTTYTDLYLSSGAQYTYTIFSYNDLCSGGPLYDAVSPLVGTYQTTGGNTYVWNQTVSGDYNVAANWTPNRIITDPSDVLVFSNTALDTVTNVPTQIIGQLNVINNTNVRMRANATASQTLSLVATSTTTNVLTIGANSSLILDGASTGLTLAFGGARATAAINGNLEVQNTGAANILNFFNVTATVGPLGTLAAGGTVATQAITYTSAGNLIMNGTYNHKYTTVVGGGIPIATWNTGSTVLISGYTSGALTAGPANMNNQTFYNFTYNCSNQTNTVNWGSTIATNTTFNALGTFSVISTGTSYLALSSSSYYIYNVNNFSQIGGILDLATGSPSIYQESFNVSGTFSQLGGTLRSSGSGTLGTMLNFNGTTGQQSVTFFNAAPTGPVTYRISNYNGINLTGAGTLTSGSAFALNSGGGMRISTTSPNPLTTTLVPTYAATGSALVFDTAANLTATANVWPATAGPFNVTIFVGQSNAVTMPGSRTIGGNLTFTSGDLNAGANNLTLGTGPATANIGTITGYNGSGFVRLTTGSLTRWFPTLNLPTSNSAAAIGSSYSTSGIGYFPVSYGPSNRNAYLYFTSSTALSTGGTATITHANAPGLAAVSITDGVYTVQSRTNASWTFTTSGMVLSGTATMGLRVTAANLFNPLTPANLRLVKAASAIDNFVTGGGTTPNVYAERSGLSISDLTTGSWYVGANNADINGLIWTAINTGNWSTTSTWDQNSVPPNASAICIINPNVTVTYNSTNPTIKVLTNNGTLNVAGSTLTIDSALYNNDTVNATAGTLKVNGNGTVANTAVGVTNNGLFNVAGGTVTVGPAGGGNKPFVNNTNLIVSSGTLNINGNLLVNGFYTSSSTPNSYFTQSGGAIVVDGNAGGVAAASVSSSFALVSLRTPNLNLTGGTFTITDPHQSTTNTFEYAANSTNAPFYNYNVPVNQSNIAAAHTFIFGDGISTDAGGTSGFKINPWVSSGHFGFGNIIINNGNITSSNNRFVALGTSTGVLGNVTVNNGGEFRPQSTSLYLKNNLTVNTGGIFTCSQLYLMDYSYGGSPMLPSAQSQIISGNGTFRNAVTGSTANLGSIYLCGGSNPTIQDSLSFSSTVYFNYYSFPTSGSLTSHIFIPQNSNWRLTEISGAGVSNNSQATGWIAGTYQKHANTGGISNTYPIGDSLYYTPVTVGGGTVTTGGDIYARVTGGLDPNIGNSTLNPLKTVKRYFTVGIPVGNPITFAANTMTVQPQWVVQDLPVGANTNVFYVALDTLIPNTNTISGNFVYPTASLKQQLTIKAINLNPPLQGNYSIGETCPPSSINVQPVGGAICAGMPDTLKTVATGLGLTYQWYKNNTGTFTAISGATSANYLIANPQTSDSGAYYVIVGGTCATPIQSNTTVLSISTPPSITTQPVSSTVCAGLADTLVVVATGSAPLTYQWYKNSTPITGATFRRHFIPAASLSDAGGYYVTITNGCGTVTSSQVSVSVSPLPSAAITSLGSTTFCAGSSVVLQAPAGNTTYSWTNNGAPSGYNSRYDTVTTQGGVVVTVTNAAGCTATSIADSVHTITAPPATITPGGVPTFCLPGSVVLKADTSSDYSYNWLLNGAATGSTGPYYTASVSGNYQVVIKNSYNCPDTSGVQVVTANPVPVPVVTLSGPATFCAGSASVTGTIPNIYNSYNWQDLNTSAQISNNNSSGAIFASGSYEVFVTDANGCAGASAPFIVTVNPAPIAIATAQGNTAICPGSSVVLAASSGTNTRVSYQWGRTGGGGGPIAGATASTYTASNPSNYYVTVKDSVTGCTNTSTPNIAVTINTPTATILPAGNQTLCQGSTTTLIANPGSSYQWYLNTTTPLATTANLVASVGGSYTVAVTNSSGCTATSAPHVITVVPNPVATATALGTTTFCAGGQVRLVADTGAGLTYTWTPGGAHTDTLVVSASGTYTVTVTNTNNCSTISNAVTVTSVPYPVPTISTGGLPSSICTGQTVQLTAGPAGNTYLWYLNGTALPYTDPNRTSMTYPANQSGTYTVTVTNSTGCAATTPAANGIQVYVNPVPTVITLGPATFCWGSSDVLTVNAGTGGGSPLNQTNPLTYQWFRDSTLITNASSSSIQVFDSGKYSVIVSVTNSCSQSSGDSIKITVNKLPVPVISGSQTTGVITCTSGPYAHYQWYLGNASIGGDTTASITVYQNGDYHVVVTDRYGCVGASSVFHKGTTGVNTVTGNSIDVSIYPNPVSSVVHIDASVPVDATIGGIDGRAIMQQADARTMDLSGLANGIYMIRVYDKTGTLLKVEKLVKASN